MYRQARPVGAQPADMNQAATMSRIRLVLTKRASASKKFVLKTLTGRLRGRQDRSFRDPRLDTVARSIARTFLQCGP